MKTEIVLSFKTELDAFSSLNGFLVRKILPKCDFVQFKTEQVQLNDSFKGAKWIAHLSERMQLSSELFFNYVLLHFVNQNTFRFLYL